MGRERQPMIPVQAIPRLIKAVEEAQRKTWESRKNGDISQEHKITSALGTRIQDGCNEVFSDLGLDVSVTCKDIADKGRGAEESLCGADLGVTIRVPQESSAYRKVKTALIQAKLPNNISTNDIFSDLGKMSAAGAGTVGSFVAVYDQDATKVSTHKQIEDAGFNAKKAKGETLGSFFENFFRCNYGRKGLDARELKLTLQPKTILEFTVHSNNKDH